MSVHSTANETLKRALKLAAAKLHEALELLELGLSKARAEEDSQGISALARHAAVICAESGNLREAAPEDAYLYFASGCVRRQLAQFEEARLAFERSLELARTQGDEDMVSLASAALTVPDMQVP